jgi:hypothetical protein
MYCSTSTRAVSAANGLLNLATMDRPCPLPNKLAIDTSIPPLVCESFIKAAQLTSNVPIASAWIPDLHKPPQTLENLQRYSEQVT